MYNIPEATIRKELMFIGTFTPLISFWYIYPVIVLFGCQLLVKLFSLDHHFKIKVLGLAIPFLQGGMHALSRNTETISILPFFFISVSLTGIYIAVFRAYYYGEIIHSRYSKMTQRLVFLSTIVLYAVLITVSILSYL